MSHKYLIVGLAVAAIASPAQGADKAKSYPNISVSIPFEIQNNAAYSSDVATNESNNLTGKIAPVITGRFTPEISVTTELTFEQVQDPAFPGEDQFFDNHGLYVSVLTANYDTDRFSVFGGKFGVNSGIAWDVTPGLFGTDLAEEYELSENLGLGGSVSTTKSKFGKHTLSASSFFADTSGLAESAFTRRRKTREGSGGPGNTGDFGSFAMALDGQEFSAIPGLRYHLSYVTLGNDTALASDESRIAIGADYQINVTKKFGLYGNVEYVNIDNADGTNDQDRFYFTSGAQATYDAWNVALSYTRKETEPSGGTVTNEEQLQISAGYAFDFGLGIDLGWKTARNAGIDTDTFGTLLTYTIEY
jgi:hypothetical protein